MLLAPLRLAALGPMGMERANGSEWFKKNEYRVFFVA